MEDRQKLIEAVYTALENAERLESDEADLGEIVRLDIQIREMSKPKEVFGRAGNFFKLAVEYSRTIERAQEVEEEREVEEEVFRRSLRLTPEGKISAVSETL
jgi:hypothetical protein